MSSSAPATDLQSLTLRSFTVLHQLHSNWGGKLILSIGLNPKGAAFAFASNIAGAVCLALEEDPATARGALRSGACDFVVNSLDEALRAMKNEVRRHLPISVGLQGSYAEVLAELLERGVAPQLVADFSGGPANCAAIETLQTQGSLALDFFEFTKKLGRIVHVLPATTNVAFGGDDWKKGYDLLRPAGMLVAYGFAN